MPGAAPRPFVFLGPDHLAVFALTAACSAAFCILARRAARGPAPERAARRVRLALAVALAATFLIEQVADLATGRWTIHEAVPLHLCDLALFACLVALWLPARRPSAARAFPAQFSYELAYFWGIGGTSQAVLTPDVPEGFPALHCVRFFLTHVGILVAVFTMTIGFRQRPAPGAVRRVWLTTAAAALVVAGFDALVGTNYMYLCGPPDRPSLFDLFGRWPWSLGPLVVVGTLLLILAYLPFWIVDRRGRRRAPGESRSSGPGRPHDAARS